MYRSSSVSIIVEILQRVEPPHFNDAIRFSLPLSHLVLSAYCYARFHFDSLAHDNGAKAAQVESVIVIANDRGDDTPSAIVLSGVQHVPKFNQASADEVRIFMALYRVETKGIDLVVTFNVPTKSSDGGAVGQDGWQPFQADFDAFVRSLRIVDQGLFA